MTIMPLKELETESAGMQTTTLTQLFVSLPRLGGGWCNRGQDGVRKISKSVSGVVLFLSNSRLA
jgi:hypothetical protein